MRPTLLALLALATTGCTKAELLDFAMHTAPRPAPIKPAVPPYQLLAGDMHTHVLPPDAPWHVSRGLDDTVRLAEAEHLDFVVLTPHVPSRFFMDEDQREWVATTQAELRAGIARHASESVMLVPGMEYTDGRYGHAGLGFASIDDVLADVPLAIAQAHPEKFFERWVARGGVITINHPTLRGLRHAPFMELRYDLGWRGLFDVPPPLPPEIAWITEHATTIETLNTSIAHLRDQFFMLDADRSLREGAHLADRTARAQHRRLTPVGGSDSHGEWLRPTTWVLARARSITGVRDALVQGRTCVRGPEACTLTVDGANVGAAVDSHGTRLVRASTSGGAATYFVNGAIVAHGLSGETVSLPVPGTCALVRAIVGQSWSAPIYVDCPWLTTPGRGT